MAGILSGHYVLKYPTLKGFIAANTYMQLTQSTLVKVFEIWRDLYYLTEYNKKNNPNGHFVIDKKPPAHWIQNDTFKSYDNIISFWNGHTIYVGSLDNYKAHDGKEFAYAHLDETKDTKEEAVKSVILARLSQRGLFIDVAGQVHYIPDYLKREDEIKARAYKSFNPVWIHTSPAIGQVDWLVQMFSLETFEPEIRAKIVGTTKTGKPDYFKKRFDNKMVVIFSTYHNAQNIPSEWFNLRMSTLSENEQMKFIYGYPFSKTGSEYYPHWSMTKHVTPIVYRQDMPNHLSWDFNVLPYMTTLAAQVVPVDRFIDEAGNKYNDFARGRKPLRVIQVGIYKEYCLATPLNTVQHTCEAFKADQASRKNTGVFLYGDASGKAKIPGMGSYTNFNEIKRHLSAYMHNESDRVGKANMGVLKRRDFINRILEGKIPTIELYVDPSCKNLIRDMNYLKLGPEGKLKEKERDPQTGAMYEKIGHTSDALEYMLCSLFKNMMTQ
jgi:hypothetical protein